VKKIQADVFKEMKKVKFIVLEIFNFKGFIHGNGIEWMNYINYYACPANSSSLQFECDQQCLETLRSLIVSIEIINSFAKKNIYPVTFYPNVQPYSFPDKDFCIFANYPHERGVLTIIEYDLPNCTCTILWLYKNLILLANKSKIDDAFTMYQFGNACFLLLNDYVQSNVQRTRFYCMQFSKQN
jgi:hypothetical protein